MDLGTKLFKNLTLDWSKEKVDKFERASLIKDFMDSKDLNIRDCAKGINISEATLRDWLLWLKINKTDYDELINQGMNDTEIYRNLRGNKDYNVKYTALDMQLTRLLKVLKNPIKLNLSTVRKIKEVQKILLRLK